MRATLHVPPAKERRRAATVLARLTEAMPGARTALHHENPFQLLIATILSAQCTDERVNMVAPGLFRNYPAAKDFGDARQGELESAIRSTGFFRMKARNIVACSKALMERHGGRVPESIEELVALPGVGRKTANVVLGQAFGIASGIVVDTHVHRLSRRLGWTAADTPEKIEQDLMRLIPPADWIMVSSVLILHGRKTCKARTPLCAACIVRTLCPSAATFRKDR
jgi:endonuclease-3